MICPDSCEAVTSQDKLERKDKDEEIINFRVKHENHCTKIENNTKDPKWMPKPETEGKLKMLHRLIGHTLSVSPSQYNITVQFTRQMLTQNHPGK